MNEEIISREQIAQEVRHAISLGTETVAASVLEIRRLFAYDASTGAITLKVARGRWGEFKPGSVATSRDGDYLRVTVDGRHFRAHRVAWLLAHGHWPAMLIDHKNGDGFDNRLTNLREATNTQNQHNQRAPHRDSKNPHLGVCWNKHTKKWQANIKYDGTRHTLGNFKDVNDAISAYKAAKQKHHPFQTLVLPPSGDGAEMSSLRGGVA